MLGYISSRIEVAIKVRRFPCQKYSSQTSTAQSMKTLGNLVIMLVMVCTLQSSLKILDTPDGKEHPEPCALVCTGISKHDDPDTSWTYLGWRNWKLGKLVDMSECKFVSKPVVTATTRVAHTGGEICPSVITEQMWISSQFYALSVEEMTVEKANKLCDIHWVATGYSC